MGKNFDIGLYALSVFVIMLSFFTVFVLTNGFQYINKTRAIIRVLLSGISIGVGIWAAFLISTIALKITIVYEASNPLSYAPLVFSVFAFLIAIRLSYSLSHSRTRILLGSLIMNLGFNCVYAFALEATCLGCHVVVQWLAFVALVLIGFLLSILTLWFALRRRGVVLTFVGSIFIGGLAAGLNAIGLNAFGVASKNSVMTGAAYSRLITQFYLALSLAAASYIICSLALVVYYRQEFLQIPAPEARERLESESI